MNKEALLRAADMLTGEGPYVKVGPIKESEFDISMFWSDRHNDIDLKDFKELSNCETTACVCGHAAVDPWFIERGIEESLLYHDHTIAFSNFFNVTKHEFLILFMHTENTPADAAQIIRKQGRNRHTNLRQRPNHRPEKLVSRSKRTG